MKFRNLRAQTSLLSLAVLGAGLPVSAFAHSTDTAAQGTATQDDGAADANAIIVTGRRAALQSADDRKKNSNAIIDSVVADEAGKLPDNSITEVLQRVSGVAIVRFAALNDPDHFSVEGSSIQVRGLSGVASRLNGRDIFSANSGRALLWGDVTPELMQAVDVYKSATADQIAGGTGGTVDLRTKLPFDFGNGLHVAGSGDIGYGDLNRSIDYSASGLIAGKWDTSIGKIGFVLDGAYSQLSTTADFFRAEPMFRTRINGSDYFIPGGYDYGDEVFQRRRDGLYAAVQWAPSSDLTLTGIFFQSRYRNHSYEHGSFVTSQTLSVDPSVSQFDAFGGFISSPAVFQRDTGTFLPSGAPISSGGTSGVWKSRTKSQDMSIAADWNPVGSRLAVHAAYQHVLSTAKLDRLDLFRTVNFPTSFGLDLSGNLPQITLDPSFAPQLSDPANYNWQAAMPHNEDNRGEMDAANIDLTYDVGDGFFKSVKVGGRWSNRTERDLNNSYAWAALGLGWNGDPVVSFADSPPGDYELYLFKDYFHNEATLPGNQYFPSAAFLDAHLDPSMLQEVFDLYGGSPGRTPGFILPVDQTDFRTKTISGYAMVNFGTDWGESSLTGNVGARVVNLKNFSAGYVQLNGLTFIYNGEQKTLPSGAVEHAGTAEFTRVLPSVNLNYSPIDPVKIRAAYNITMDLPSFSALSGAGNVSVSTTPDPNNPNGPAIFTGYSGNTGDPLLKPTMSNNFDMSFEWYPKAGTTFHLAAFYKRITNLVIYSSGITSITLPATDGTPITGNAIISNAHNSPEAATVKGIEVGGRTFFDKLPGMLSGFGVEANYTYLSSKSPGDIYFDIDGVQHNDAPLQGLSKHNFNVALLYEHNPFSVRVAYSWRSKYLQSTNANGTNQSYNFFTGPNTSTNIATNLPVYGDSYGTLDAGVTIRVNDNFSFSVKGTNLLNATTKTLMGGYPGGLYGRSWFQNDRRVSMGMNVSF